MTSNSLTMTPTDLLVLALSSGYLAYVFTHTDGPFAAFKWARTRYPLGGMTTCIYCLAPWTALVLYLLLFTPFAAIPWILAGAGGGLMLAAWTGLKHL